MRKHSGSQFECGECEAIFRDHYELKLHQIVKHKNDPLLCHQCRKSFYSVEVDFMTHVLLIMKLARKIIKFVIMNTFTDHLLTGKVFKNNHVLCCGQ